MASTTRNILVYKVFTEDHGDQIIIAPDIPKSPMKKENTTIPRISVAPTILQCLRAIDIPERICESGMDSMTVYVYATWITDRSVVHQPVTDEVPDQWITGELWIRNKCPFVKVCKATVTKQFDLPNVPYSRFQFVSSTEEPPIDRVASQVIHGEEFSFSFLEINPTKISEAIIYADQHPYIL